MNYCTEVISSEKGIYSYSLMLFVSSCAISLAAMSALMVAMNMNWCSQENCKTCVQRPSEEHRRNKRFNRGMLICYISIELSPNVLHFTCVLSNCDVVVFGWTSECVSHINILLCHFSSLSASKNETIVTTYIRVRFTTLLVYFSRKPGWK